MSVVRSTEEALQRLDEAENVIDTSNMMLLDKIRTQKRKNGWRRLARDQEEKDEQFAEAVISIIWVIIVMLALGVSFVVLKY
ncbi:hypothetical protein GCK72_007073 [Caenorhabditis remanei]|uniref:Uncharacterized protein n=1 Tax=Caenorhabditis remanei TaxID=31234 RepID=A0A6A5HI02_CAERE|nr:hypothetical protein GCK72_007073 [Caenorhabditis remanei]KAF1767115.1 hypothetical protein GCK72_007073 [Caenorhabditis remanei]